MYIMKCLMKISKHEHNPHREAGTAETTTAAKKKEVDDFLAALLCTRPMQYCHQFLVAKVGDYY